FEARSFGRFPNGVASVFIVAKKPLVEKPVVKPTQGFYRRHWRLDGRANGPPTASSLGGILDLQSIEAA
ncbi:MAG: hypothetical protein ACREJM_14790, partial [Candidatus Saccharimonadales bacterium]